LYLVTSENNEYFYTSNRLGGKGKYDIYVSLDKIQQEIPAEALAMHVMDKSEIPPAVSLVDMEVNSSVELTESKEAMAVSENEIIMEDEMISLEGAVMISQGTVILTNSQVYFIQVASLSKVSNNNAPFRRLVEFGNVYRVKKNRSYKIRLGYYPDEREAEKVLSKVRSIGFKDAFVVVEELDVKNLELLMSSFNFHKTGEFVKSEEESEYKIRLAAYSNPLYFDTEKVKDIGVIEQWSKDKWTIFLISGYKNMEEAQAARIKAINRGFKGAEIVLDKGGVLERVKSN